MTYTGYGTVGYEFRHVRIFPYADGGSLDDQLRAGSFPRTREAQAVIGSALDAALDVRMRRRSVVLADLDRAVQFGTPIIGRPLPRYCMPGRDIGSPADASVDLYSRDALLTRLGIYVAEAARERQVDHDLDPGACVARAGPVRRSRPAREWRIASAELAVGQSLVSLIASHLGHKRATEPATAGF